MKKIIKWIKWVDPFESECESNQITNEEQNDREYMDSYEKAEKENKRIKYSGPVLIGPMGIIPINENNSPSKVYNFWMMHSNFNISKKVVDALKECPGVETLDIFTRYRARIGIGKVFNDSKIRKRINKMLCTESEKEPEKPKLSEKLDTIDILKKQMSQKYKFWAIAIQTNNELKLFGGDTQEFVQTKISENEYVKIHKSWE